MKALFACCIDAVCGMSTPVKQREGACTPYESDTG